jgi:hypothetical protein
MAVGGLLYLCRVYEIGGKIMMFLFKLAKIKFSLVDLVMFSVLLSGAGGYGIYLLAKIWSIMGYSLVSSINRISMAIMFPLVLFLGLSGIYSSIKSFRRMRRDNVKPKE